MVKNYPELHDHLEKGIDALAHKLPGTMSGFMQMHQATVEDGALDARTKELIALGIAIAVRCDGCISYHVHDAVEAGATRDEMAETIGVAVLMGGGPAVVYGSEAWEAVEQFEAVGAAG
jgi:AhpD family alkylhydroperoxidase